MIADPELPGIIVLPVPSAPNGQIANRERNHYHGTAHCVRWRPRLRRAMGMRGRPSADWRSPAC
jgi:hypothetical protein